MSRAANFLNHPIAAKWGTGSGITQYSEVLDEVLKPYCSILLVGTGSSEEQYYDWPKVLSDVWNSKVSYLEVYQPYIDLWTGHIYPVIKGDVRQVTQTFDAILWIQGPEHILYQEMLPTFDILFEVSKLGIVCACPWGKYYDSQGAVGGNKYETHLQHSMDKNTFGKEFKNYTIQFGGTFNGPDGQILIHRSRNE